MIGKTLLSLIVLIYSSIVFSIGFPVEKNINILEERDSYYSIDNYSSNIKSKKYVKLFSQTCDNISYTGAIENQAIKILEKTDIFIRELTDPIVEVSKFELGIFVYAFSKCLGEETKKSFSECEEELEDGRKVSVGDTCFIDNLIDAISETGALKTTCGIEGNMGASGSAGASCRTNLDKEAAKTAIPGTIERVVGSGLFKKTFDCIEDERSKLINKINDIFKKNKKVKASILSSVNNTCNVALREEGDPTTWSEIYKQTAEMAGKTGDATKLGFLKDIEETTDQELLTASISDFGMENCIDGYGTGGCLTEKQKAKMELLSKTIPTSKLSNRYSKRKAFLITNHFYDSEGNILDKYSESGVIKEILKKYRPQECSDTGCVSGPDFDLSGVLIPKYLDKYLQLKNQLNIKNDDLGVKIDFVYNDIFPQEYEQPISPTQSIKRIPKLNINPFKEKYFSWNSDTNSEGTIIMKTMAGNNTSIVNSEIKTREAEKIALFYQELIFRTLMNKDEKEAAYYKKYKIISLSNFNIIKTNLLTFISDNENQNFEDIIGNRNELKAEAGKYRASLEASIMEDEAWKLIIRNIFQGSEDPKLTSVIDKGDVNYNIISKTKDFIIPESYQSNINNHRIRSFFQMLSSQYVDYKDIEISAKKVEDWKGLSKREIMINALTNKGNKIDELNQVKNSYLFNYK